MAITYHSARRIQGLERTGSTPTYEPDLSSSSGWALTNGGGTASIANNEVTLTANSNTDNPIATYDLGATVSDTNWVMTFKLVYSGFQNSATGNGIKYGVGLGSSATTTDLDGWNTAGMSFIEYDFRGHASTSVWQPSVAGGNSSGRTETGGSNYPDGGGYSATQYVKLYRLTSTTARMEFYLQSDYSDTPVTLNVTMANTPTGLQYLFLRLFYENVSDSNTIVASEFKIYNGVTSIVVPAGDVKPTNVQAGSRFEETDTRKMYHYEVGDPTYETDFSTNTGWTQSDTSQIGVNVSSSGKLKFYNSGSNSLDNVYYDLGSNVSDTKWVLRHTLTVSGTPSTDEIPYKLEINNTANAVGNTNSKALGWWIYVDRNNAWRRIYTVCKNSTSIGDGEAQATPRYYSDFSYSTVYYITTTRHSATKFEVIIRTGSHTGSIVSGGTLTQESIPSGITGLRYLTASDGGQGAGLTAEIDDLEFYNGVTTPVMPNAWKELGT